MLDPQSHWLIIVPEPRPAGRPLGPGGALYLGCPSWASLAALQSPGPRTGCRCADHAEAYLLGWKGPGIEDGSVQPLRAVIRGIAHHSQMRDSDHPLVRTTAPTLLAPVTRVQWEPTGCLWGQQAPGLARSSYFFIVYAIFTAVKLMIGSGPCKGPELGAFPCSTKQQGCWAGALPPPSAPHLSPPLSSLGLWPLRPASKRPQHPEEWPEQKTCDEYNYLIIRMETVI